MHQGELITRTKLEPDAQVRNYFDQNIAKNLSTSSKIHIAHPQPEHFLTEDRNVLGIFGLVVEPEFQN